MVVGNLGLDSRNDVKEINELRQASLLSSFQLFHILAQHTKLCSASDFHYISMKHLKYCVPSHLLFFVLVVFLMDMCLFSFFFCCFPEGCVCLNLAQLDKQS